MSNQNRSGQLGTKSFGLWGYAMTRTLRLMILSLSIAALAGCSKIDVALKTPAAVNQKVKHVISHPGQAITILDQVTVKGRLHTGDEVDQDIGGWKAMPNAHYDFLSKYAKIGRDAEDNKSGQR